MQKVTDPALLAQLNGGGQVAAPRPMQQPSAPGVIVGRPKAGPSGYQQQQDSINNQQEAERLRIAQENANLGRQKDELDIAKKQREAAAGDLGDAIEGERKAASFLLRALGSNRDYEAQDIGPRSYVGQKLADNAPDLLNVLPESVGNSPERQISDSAQDAFIAASLRQDSGAAIPPEELERQRRIYFPMPGDTEAVIAAKKVRRDEAIAGLKMSAGRLGDETLTTYQTQFGGDAGTQEGRSALPTAAGARADPGLPTDGVTPKGTGGYTPVPELYGVGDSVANLIGRGASHDQVIKFLAEKYAPYGLEVSTELNAAMNDVVQQHKADPSKPVKSLVTGWDMLHMRPDGQGGSSLVGEVADSPVGAAVIGAADTVTGGFGDEIAGALGADTEAIRAATEFSRQERPVATFAGSAAGGAMLPMGRATSASSLAKGGAAYGGIYGAGSANGNVGDRLTGALGGAAVGGLVGGTVGKGVNALSGVGSNTAARQASRNALLQDFQQEGVRALPANVGGTMTNRMTSGMAQSPVGSAPIRAAAKEQGATFGTAIGNAAGRSGRAMPADEAGEAFRQSARAGIERDGQRIGRIYDAAKNEASGVKIKPNQGIRQIDDEIAKLSETAEINQPLINELNKLKASLQQNTAMSIDGLKTARSFAGKAASNQELRATPAKATMARVFDALATDFEGGLRAAGKGKAATLFKRADGLWKARIDDIDGAWEPIIGTGKSGEDIVKSIETMASGGKGGFVRLKTVLSGASPTERGDMIATLIDRMGQARKGAQSAEGDVFSPNVFLTNWNGMSKKAKALMFGNTELRQSLDRLSRISESVKDSAGFANSSNTGGAIAAQGLVGMGGYSLGNLPGLAMTTGATYMTGKMLASPRFAAWLARAPRNAPPAQARAYVERLKSIATAEPVIAADVSKFAQFLNAANDVSPSRAVAQGQQEDN